MSSSPYAPAAKLLNEIWTKRKGLKSVAYSRQGDLLCSKATYAQCAHVLQHKGLLDRLLRENKMIEAKNTGLLYVLLYELVLGPNKKIRGGGALKRQLVQNKEGFMETLRQIQPDDDNNNDEHDDVNVNATMASKSITIPRYVRVNTIQTTVPEVLRHLKDQKNIRTVFQDEHVPDLLVLPPTADSRAALQDLLLKNHIVLQDKSSCFSALCLVHGYASDLLSTNTITDDTTTKNIKKKKKSSSKATAAPIGIIDACAAPGNKTSHLAALTTTTTTTSTTTTPDAIIYAFDKSKDRFQMLQRRMDALAGVVVGQEETTKSTTTTTVVECHNLDFFKASSSSLLSAKPTTAKDHHDHQNFDNVRAIMLDPSCSGSGMASNHQEASRDPFFVDDRVKSLSKFQLQALQHATSLEHFPLVERVVYSTCSLYLQENEQVVATFLKDQEDWILVAPKCLQGWKRRGLAYEGLTEAQSNALLRVHPDEDATNGFFVACLERRRIIHPSKRPPSKSHTTSWRGAPPIEGLQFYHGEFHHHKEEPAVKHSSPVTRTKRKSAETSTDKQPTTKDSIILQPGKKARHEETTTNNPSSPPVVDDSSKLRKKIAKKLEWKRKQRERKQARLLQKSKPKENTDETGSK